MKVTNIENKAIVYDLSKWPKFDAKLRALLPTRKREIISFVLRNTDTPTANGLRRTLIEELPVKILHLGVGDIETDEEYLIRDELIDRIHSIPIDQSVSADAIFSIDIVNTDVTKRIGHIYSGDISGDNKVKDFSDKRFRIAELHPGKFLQVNNIRILQGYGYMHANFMLTCGIRYKPLDFIDVTRVNTRGFLERGMASTEYVLAEAKKKKASLTELSLQQEKILFIPSSECKDHMSEVGRSKLDSYIVINKDVEFHSSSVSHPTVYYLEVETLGTVPAYDLIKMACDNLVARFQKIHDGLEVYLKDVMAEPTDVNIKVNITQKNSKITIIGETHTVAEVLVCNVQKLDPMVANVSKHIIHPMTRAVEINIMHAEPIRILMDACKMAVANYTIIGKSF